MYYLLLSTHSLFRWLVLICLLYAIFSAYKGWLENKPFTKYQNNIRYISVTIAHTQLTLGLWLYFISPITNYFMHNYKQAVKLREIRFFGMEHSLMMIIAVTIITIGSAKTKLKKTDKEKFKTMAIWFTIGLLVILTSIPWKFSPLTSRPYFRTFYFSN